MMIQPQTVTFKADNTEVLEAARQIQGISIDEKTMTVTADTADAVSKVAALKGMMIQPQTVRFTTDDSEVMNELSKINGLVIDDKTMTITVNSAEAYNQIQELIKDTEGTTVTFNIAPARSQGVSITTQSGLNNYINSLKQQIDQADLGSDLYNSLTSKLADATMLQNLIKESLSAGLGTALFDIANQMGQDFWDRVLSPEGVENADWQAIADVINQKRKEMGLDALTLDFKTGTISGKNNNGISNDSSEREYKELVDSLSQVNSGLQQLGVTIPDEVNNTINAMHGLMSIIQGIQSLVAILNATVIPAEVASINANTIAVSANTAAQASNTAIEGTGLLSSILQVGSVLALEHGGIIPHAAHGYAVPGTHYSGDTTPILANAGEVVLNRAQQGNLASQLQDNSPNAPRPARPYVTGQDVFLGINNYLNGSNQGEIVTTKMLRSMGIL